MYRIWLDMVINVKKSCCMRIGPRNDYTVSNIVTVMVINFRGLMKFGIWVLTLYKVDSLNVFSIMPKNRSFVRLTLSLVKLVGMHPKKSSWS